jgi:translation initiation factor IF-2
LCERWMTRPVFFFSTDLTGGGGGTRPPPRGRGFFALSLRRPIFACPTNSPDRKRRPPLLPSPPVLLRPTAIRPGRTGRSLRPDGPPGTRIAAVITSPAGRPGGGGGGGGRGGGISAVVFEAGTDGGERRGSPVAGGAELGGGSTTAGGGRDGGRKRRHPSSPTCRIRNPGPTCTRRRGRGAAC